LHGRTFSTAGKRFKVRVKLSSGIQNTRALALMALLEIWQRGGKPKTVLEDIMAPLDKRDRAFLMELVYGVVRYRDTLDWILKKFLKKPSGLSPWTRNNLRTGTYQILFMRVPKWAAVNEAVEIEKWRGKPAVVNAVLQRLSRDTDGIHADLLRVKKKDDATHIAISTSHPEWLIRRWITRFGGERARQLAEANNRVPPMTLRVNTLRVGRDEIVKRIRKIGIQGKQTRSSPDGFILEGFHHFRELSSFRGLAVVQDEASQLITYLLDPRAGERILDACAAPGGKTTHIAQRMDDRGEIVAVDADEMRIKLLRESLSALGITSVKVIMADITELGHEGFFDRVLLDAPCSSLGVIRRNPDVKYRHCEEDLMRFRMKQIRLLTSVSGLVKSGGILLYSVCSPEPEEGEEVIEEFLKVSPDFYIIETTVPFLKEFMNKGFFRTYPHRDAMDGFFGVRLCRRA
jgi:16S rRNA (cytosine967-C5)-methyltransferase